jgi:hypothetical protein
VLQMVYFANAARILMKGDSGSTRTAGPPQ